MFRTAVLIKPENVNQLTNLMNGIRPDDTYLTQPLYFVYDCNRTVCTTDIISQSQFREEYDIILEQNDIFIVEEKDDGN